MRRVILMLVIISMLFSLGLSKSAIASAASEPVGNQTIAKDLSTVLKDRNNNLIEYLKHTSSSDIVTAIDTFVTKHAIVPYEYKDKVKDFHDESLVRTVTIDDETTVTFSSDGSFVVDKLTSRRIANPTGRVTTMATYSKWAANDRTAYDMFGWALYHIHIESYFGYNGTQAWYAGGLVGYYQRYLAGGVWQVSNWEVGTTVINGGEYCRAYARGNFHFGLEYQGIGWIIQDVYEDVRVSVTRDGTVYVN